MTDASSGGNPSITEDTVCEPKIQGDDYLSFFQEWIQRLEESLHEKLPKLPETSKTVFCAACCAVQAADKAQSAATAVVDALNNRKDPKGTEQELQDAKKAVDDAKATLESAKETCKSIAANSLLNTLDDFFSPDYDDADLVVYTVLTHGTAQGLAEWCEASSDKADELVTALKEPNLLRLFLQSGGARNGKYGPAVQAYRRFMKSPNCNGNRVLHDLALATALELADPYNLFNQKGATDILQRYMHYEQAYLLGELDPNFGTFNVWELRQVVNSDATEEELGWGRRSLAAYRPDICLWPDDQWTYCRVVKTDVAYKAPEYGRFICKAYGIPTWGVRQPGHAAMTRWTPHGGGWVTRLGAGMAFSWWEDQGGLDFYLETEARTACGSLKTFAEKILRLQWVAKFYKEDQTNIRLYGIPDECSPWCSLGMMHRCVIASQKQGATVTQLQEDPCVEAKIQRIRLHKLTIPHKITDDSKTIVIPSATCTSPSSETKKVLFLPSFLGGQQLFLEDDAEVEYTLPESCLGTFELSLMFATAHRFEKNLSITCGDESYEIPMKYTMAVWDQTEAVKVRLSTNKLVLRRPKQPFGVSFREMKLVRVDSDCCE